MRQSTLGKEIGSLQRVLEKSQEVTESVETPQTTAEIEGLKRQIEELSLQREASHHVYDTEDLQSQLEDAQTTVNAFKVEINRLKGTS